MNDIDARIAALEAHAAQRAAWLAAQRVKHDALMADVARVLARFEALK